jgi:predicted extracellular nuclease
MKKSLLRVLICLLISGCTTLNLAPQSPELAIHDIQGCNHTSPYRGQTVSEITGIVTWKDQHGFYMQDPTPDDRDCSSEGIYVFTNRYPENIPGDQVIVSGIVEEFAANNQNKDQLTLTEITSPKIHFISSGNALPAPTIIGKNGKIPPDKIIEDDQFSNFDISEDGLDFYESLESMRVEIEQAVVIQPENSYHEIYVLPAEMQAENLLSPQGALLSIPPDQNPERIQVTLPDSFKKTVYLGVQFDTPIMGILSYAYGSYTVIETNQPQLTHKTTQKDKFTGTLSSSDLLVATYNVDNLSRSDLARITSISDQIVHSLNSPDILILQEIQDDSGEENDGTIAASKALKTLIDQIQKQGGPKYHYVDNPPTNNSSGGVSGGNIRTVFLYRTDRGLSWRNTSISVNAEKVSAFKNNRQPVLGTFQFEGQNIYIIGVHLVSNLANTPEFGAIQPQSRPEEPKRIAQAQWIANFARSLQNQDPSACVLVAGDFNDVPGSSTLTQFPSVQWVNLAADVPSDSRYSILYQGSADLFDQILISHSFTHHVTIDAAVIHLNTSAPAKKQISDHDPFIVKITFKDQE